LADDEEPEATLEQLPVAMKTLEKPEDEREDKNSPCILFEGAERLLALQSEAWEPQGNDFNTQTASELKRLQEDLQQLAPLLGDVAKELFGKMGEDAKLPAKQTNEKKKKKMMKVVKWLTSAGQESAKQKPPRALLAQSNFDL
jgi:hypothetical protein